MLKHIFKAIITLLLLINFMSLVKGQDKPTLYQTFILADFDPATGGYLSIIDALTLKEIRRINLFSSNTSRIELTLDKKKAAIANSPFSDDRKGMLVVDLLLDKVTKLFDDISVYEIEIAPDGKIWALLDETGELAIIDPSTLEVTKFKLDEAGRDIVFSPDGSKAYISLFTKNIQILDVKDLRSAGSISQLPPRNKNQVRRQELEISPSGDKLYISGQTNISIIDISSRLVTETIPLPISSTSLLLKVTPDGKNLYAAEYLGADFAILDLETKQNKSFRAPQTTGILASVNFSSTGQLAYISGFYGISIFDTKQKSLISSVQTSSGIGFPNPSSLGLTISGDSTLGQAPTLTTISPSAGDNLFANQQIQINWQTTVAPQSFSIASHKVELSTDNGQTFTTIPGAEELPAETRSFTWTVPNIQSANAQIRVSTVDLGAKRAASTTGAFSILQSAPIDTQAPTVNFNSPIGGESFTSGSNLAINWVSSDNIAVTSQDLSLSLDGGQTFPITIGSGLAGSVQSFSLPITSSLITNQARLRLVVRDAAGNMSQAVTANNFSIQAAIDNIAPTVTISQPTTNTTLVAGGPIQVNWASTDNRAVVSQALLLSLNGGQSFTQVASFGANDSSFVLNNINGLSLSTPQAIVRITATDQAGNTGQANTTFIISPMVMMASYQAKILNVSGIGFMSNNGNNNLQVFINGKQVNVAAMNLTNNSFSLKGNKKKLNLVKGANTINLVIEGVMSNQISFQF